jgi:hypothetical protein
VPAAPIDIEELHKVGKHAEVRVIGVVVISSIVSICIIIVIICYTCKPI